MSSSRRGPIRVAVLHQAIEPPIINGVRKPMKPGGYQDSGADIAYSLQIIPNVKVLTPDLSPDPRSSSGWTFPDTPSAILSAIQAGATHLWANTILFSSHPLQTLTELDEYQDSVRVIGQPPNLVQIYDDKAYVNSLLRSNGYTLPKSWTLTSSPSLDLNNALKELDLTYPIVGKPIRGRGSSGVKLCHSPQELFSHIESLFHTSPTIMLEEYLSGGECTISIMPSSSFNQTRDYWALPIVKRFNHEDGVAPYNGVVAVTQNSKVLTDGEREGDESYGEVVRECVESARLLCIRAPIRVDVRRFREGEKFALFDVNMKPNMTGPGRPGREDQASLIGMAAEAIGWDYPRLLQEILSGACTLRELREIMPSNSVSAPSS